MSAAPNQRVGAFALAVQLKHSNSTSVEDFLGGATAVLGKKDFSRPLHMLEGHWVQTVGDLRLLVQEGLLRTLGLPLRLCVWVEEELSRVVGAVADEKSNASPDSAIQGSDNERGNLFFLFRLFCPRGISF